MAEAPRARVAVVGGGLGGLCLARVLQQRGVAATVFEAEEGPDARQQGGSLDLHHHTAQRALREAGLYAVFLEKVQTGADAMTIMDENLEVVYEDEGDGSRPEIERADLRKLLLDSLKPGSVRWGHKLASVEPPFDDDSGPVRLVFNDGTEENADAVVGADGAWSKVRQVLTDAKPAYTGASFVDATYSESTDVSFLRQGTLFGLDERGNVALGHIGKNAHIYFGKRCPRDEVSVLRASDIVAGWAMPMQALAATPPQHVLARSIDALPVGLTWTRDAAWKRRVAIIGDAAHLMSPFAGEGANLALADAADLAKALAQAIAKGRDLGAAIAHFEKYKMWPRSAEAARESQENLEFFFEGKGAHAVASWMRSMFSVRNFIAMGLDYLRKLAWWFIGYDYFY